MGKHVGPADRWPHIIRDLSLAVMPPTVAWISAELVPQLQALGGGWAVVAGATVSLVALLTPITRRYGVGGSQDISP